MRQQWRFYGLSDSQAAKLSSPLGPHDLRHTFAKSLLDPAAYGLDRPPMPLPAIQQLLGHADISTSPRMVRTRSGASPPQASSPSSPSPRPSASSSASRRDPSTLPVSGSLSSLPTRS